MDFQFILRLKTAGHQERSDADAAAGLKNSKAPGKAALRMPQRDLKQQGTRKRSDADAAAGLKNSKASQRWENFRTKELIGRKLLPEKKRCGCRSGT